MSEWMGIGLAVVLGLALFFALVIVVDGNRFRVVTYGLASGKLKREYRFVALADLHNKRYGRDNERLLRAIHELKPQAVMIAGDMITAVSGCSCEPALKLLEALKGRYPVYYGMGNHEQRPFLYPEEYGDMGPAYERALAGLGLGFLRDESRGFGEEITVTGLNLERCYYKRIRHRPMEEAYLKEALGKPEKNRYHILLAHNPEYFPEYAKWGADLVISGHVHGGVMRLPFLGGVISPAIRFFPRYDGGLFREGKSVMVLSRGLGGHSIPIRIFNPGELVCIVLKPE